MKKLSLITILCIICFACTDDSINEVMDATGERITAAYKMDEVDALSRSFSMELRLISIKSETVNPDGTSSKWIYEYVATTPSELGKTYCFHATYDSVVFDSIKGPKLGPAVITHTWFNSDVALSIANQNGGYQFIKQNLQYTLNASMGEPLVPNSTTFWWITYREAGNRSNYLAITIDANTGVVTSKYP